MKNTKIRDKVFDRLMQQAQEYMDLQCYIEKHENQLNQKQQVRYKFLYTFLNSKSILEGQLTTSSSDNQKRWKLKGNRRLYYIPQTKREVFQHFLNRFSQQDTSFFQSQEAHFFTQLFLERQDPIQFLNFPFQTICRQFPEGVIPKLRTELLAFDKISKKPQGLFKFYDDYQKLEIPRDLKTLFYFQNTYLAIMNFLKNSELYAIATEVPPFFLICQSQDLESGFSIQRKLFPNILSKHHIYGKDYQHMRNLNARQAQKIGIQPKDPLERQMKIYIGRQGAGQYQDSIDLTNMVCGTHIGSGPYRQIEMQLQEEPIDQSDQD